MQTPKSKNRWTLKTKVKKGLSQVTLAEYLDKAQKKARPKSEVDYHLQQAGRTRFCNECVARGLPRPIPEFKPFEDIGRRHAVDFLFEHGGVRLALEVEGWGHRTLHRYTEDQWKYNELAIRRIYLVRVKPKSVYKDETFELIRRFFGL